MPIYTGGGQYRRGKNIFDFEAPLSDVLGATAEEAWLFNPLSSIKRATELSRAMHGDIGDVDDFEDAEISEPPTPVLSADVARKQVRELGLDLSISDDGIPEGALDILVERKQNEVARRTNIQRSPTGVGPTVLKLGTALAVSVFDPINVVASFIPVVGPLRYTNMLKKATGAAGRAGVRAKVGAVEGAFGQVLVEPVVYRAAQQEQADYGLADSLLNVAFGTVFGAGLHMGGGALKDAFSKNRPWQTATPDSGTPTRVNSWSPQERVEISKIALAQATSGRPIDVESAVQLRDAIAEVVPSTIADARLRAVEKIRTELQNELKPELDLRISIGEQKKLKSEQISLKVKINSTEKRIKKLAKQIQKTENKTGRRAHQKAKQQINAENKKIQSRLDEVRALMARQDTGAKNLADLENLKKDIVPDKYVERVNKEARATMRLLKRGPLTKAVQSTIEDPNSKVARAWANVKAAAEAQGRYKTTVVSDPVAAEKISARVADQSKVKEDADSAKLELEDELDQLQELVDELGAGDVVKQLDSFDEKITIAESNKKALRALALCQFRRG